MTICSVDGCGRGGPIRHGLCSMHSSRMRKYGETGPSGYLGHARREAIKKGLTHYFTGIACVRGHFAKRHTKNRMCVACASENRSQWYKDHTQEIKITNKSWYFANRERLLRKAKEKYYKTNHLPETKLKLREAHLKRSYGISLDQYEQMKLSQNHGCKICERKIKLHVDHCHVTGRVRGLLCIACNTMIGRYENLH